MEIFPGNAHGRSSVLTQLFALQVILKEKVKELNLHEVSTSWGNKGSLILLFLTLGKGKTLTFHSIGSRARSQLCFGNGERSSAKVWIKPSPSSWLRLGFPASLLLFIAFLSR